MTEILLTLWDALVEAFLDTVKILPFLFLAYVVLELIEHKGGTRAKGVIRRSGSAGPLAGALLGTVPQCGFAAVAAEFYAGRVITVGTLVAVFLASSDEMLPVLVANGTPLPQILKLLSLKFLVGIICGFSLDLVLRLLGRGAPTGDIGDLCEREHCHCEEGIFRSALHHTLHALLYLFLVTLLLTVVIAFVGEETLKGWFSALPAVELLFSAIFGMIPNCASSVVLSELYLEGVIGVGSLMAGLLPGAGVGILALFRANRKGLRENFSILLFLFLVGMGVGALLEFTPVGAFFL